MPELSASNQAEPSVIPTIIANTAKTPHATEMHFGAASVVPSSANEKDRTVDVVWYGGASVPRINQRTGDPYNLRLDMAGARLDRLNAGAPVFDNHQSGNGLAALINPKVAGTRAQLGVVRKAWADGALGKATLQFDASSADPEDPANRMWGKISSGILQSLSFGTWIYEMQPDGGRTPLDDEEDGDEPQNFVATDWEPFEISPACVPADYQTQFLSAEVAPEPPVTQKPVIQRATAQEEQPVMSDIQAAGAESGQVVTPPVIPSVNPEVLRQEGIQAERARTQAIRLAVKPFLGQLGESFVASLIDENLTVEASRDKILEKLAARTDALPTRGEIAITRDETDTQYESMEASLLVRFNPDKYKDLKEKGREYVGMSLIELAKECLTAQGVKHRGQPKAEIARLALLGRHPGRTNDEQFAYSAASSSDFPSILANVANKTLRQAYEAYPSTFKPFCRQVTAADFKPINRVQLSDISALQALNESGEYHRTTPTDSKETYSLATFGEIVAITRKVIINDDLQAFTRVPMLLGVAAARLEADKVWAIITANAAMGDGVNLFDHTSHSNSNSGAGTALGVAGLGSARSAMRQQTGPKGTILNLVPMYILVPSALETTVDQLVAPINIASTDFSKVVPGWIRSLNPIVEPRLDANSAAYWYLVADPASIDTIEYCYLEGQEGVYTETRQGFEVDGVEIKARMDFAAAPIEYRGLQVNIGS